MSPTRMTLQSFSEGTLQIDGYRTKQGTVALAAVAFDGRETLITEVPCHGIRRAFLRASKDREVTALVGKLVKETRQRYEGEQALAEDHAIIGPYDIDLMGVAL